MYKTGLFFALSVALCCTIGCNANQSSEGSTTISRGDATHPLVMYRKGPLENHIVMSLDLEDGSISIKTGPTDQMTSKNGSISSLELTNARELFTEDRIALYEKSESHPIVNEGVGESTDDQDTSQGEVGERTEDSDEQTTSDEADSPATTPEQNYDNSYLWEHHVTVDITKPETITFETNLSFDINDTTEEVSELLTYLDNLVAQYR